MLTATTRILTAATCAAALALPAAASASPAVDPPAHNSVVSLPPAPLSEPAPAPASSGGADETWRAIALGEGALVLLFGAGAAVTLHRRMPRLHA